MGNYRFKLSDMIPNAWFYKLKDMRRPRNAHLSEERTPSKSKQQQQQQKPRDLNPRKSYYFSRELVPVDGFYVTPERPRKSSKKRYHSRRRNFRTSSPQPPSSVITSSVSTGCSCRETVWSKADSPPDYSDSSSSLSSSDDSSPLESSDADVKKTDEMHELELPPIVTKPAKFNDMIKDIKKKYNNTGPPVKQSSANSSGVRLRTHSPRIGNRRLNQGHGRKSMSSTSSCSSSKKSTLSESLAVVKSSFDPQRDFRESMVEMILENNIRTSKELEDLLASYLSLNSDEYHELIIKVFKQIWFDLNDVLIN